jgi:hypothetical protein
MATDVSVSTDTGLSNPTLSFGLTTVSDWSTQMAFLDLMKMSRAMIGHSATVWNAMSVDQLEAGGHLDADGWPMSIPEGLTSIGTIWDWGGSSAADPAAAASRAGVYVLEYEGTGTLQLQGVTVLSSEPGRIVVQNLTGGSMVLNITSTDPGGTGDYIRNITMVAEEHVALHEAGQMFNPDWLAIVQDARELRFKDWMAVDGETSAEWGDRPQVDDVTWSGGAGGVPVEVMVALANQTGTEPWFTMPAGASEEYIRNFATYVRDHLDPELEVHVEYSNELWNWAYPQTQWMAAQATANWGAASGGPAWLDYTAMLATKSALIWDEVFGAEADHRVDNVLGSQVVNTWLSERLLTAPLWQTMDPDGYVAPHSVFDSLAVATYFGAATIGNATLRDELVTVLNTPGVDATAWLAAKLMDPDYASSVPQLLGWCADIKAVVDQYGIDLISYEGGSHVMHSWAVDGLSDADLAAVMTFLTEFTRSEAMAELYLTLWTGWAAISDGPFMQFIDVEAPSKYGAFGLFSALGDSNPRADLLMELNIKSTAWFEAR